jgi:hypothetical protein
MRLYHLIQEKIFDTYEEWQLRSSLFRCDGFHIVGIDNYLKAMRDGYNMFVEIRPPHAVKGCTSMKTVRGKHRDRVDLSLDIHGKRYGIADLGYEEAVQIMRAFVQKSVLPDERKYVELSPDDPKKAAETFGALAEMLLGDAACAQRLRKKLRRNDEEGIRAAWESLYKELVRRGRAVELDWKSGREEFAAAVNVLTAGTGLVLDEALLDEAESVPQWSGALNALWDDHILAAMDLNTDSYVLLVLTRTDFERAAALAGVLLLRIAPAEKM